MPSQVLAFGAFTTEALKAIFANAGSQFQASAVSNAAIPSGLLTGAADVVLNTTANGANALSTPSASQMIADEIAALSPYLNPSQLLGLSWELTIQNTGNNTVTLSGGTGVTINGTATIATATWRKYIVTVTGTTSITLQNVGSGSV